MTESEQNNTENCAFLTTKETNHISFENKQTPEVILNSSQDTDDGGSGNRDSMEENGDSVYQQFRTKQDQGWSWVVALASHVICALVGGLVYTGGVLLDDFQAEFDVPRSAVAMAASCQIGLYQMGGPVASLLVNRFGPRTVIVLGTLTSSSALMIASWSPDSTVLVLTYGALCGLGLSMMYLAGIVAVSTHFHKKRAVATGLATCGSGVGMVVFAPLTDLLLELYGWRWTLLVLGSVVLHGLVSASLVRPSTEVKIRDLSFTSKRNCTNKKAEIESIVKLKQWTLVRKALNFSVLKRTKYWFVLAGNFFASLGLIVPLLYISERAKQVGIDHTQAVFLLSIIGITNTAGRFLSALLVQIFRLNNVLVTALALLLCGLVTELYPICESYSPLAAMSALFGLGMAAYVTLCSVMLCDLLGPTNLASAFGYVTMMRGVASMLGPPLAGAIIDSTGKFAPAFYLGGGMVMLGGIFHLLLYLIYFKLKTDDLDLGTLAEERDGSE